MKTWQQQVELLLKTANKAERAKIIQRIKEKTAQSVGADQAVVK